MNVLISSAGRRGALVKILRESVAKRGGKVFAIDASDWSAACRLADDWKQVPRCGDPAFISTVLDHCQRNDIRLVIPTIDPELPVYARQRDLFRQHGISIAVSSPETIKISSDKLATDRFLAATGLPGVVRVDPAKAATYPLIVKPRFGSASSGVQIVQDREELDFFVKRTSKPIVQQLASGDEYTVNFYVDLNQQCRVAVPHRRVETRGGEVSKCVTEMVPELVEIAHELAKKLPGAWGPMCYQAFVSEQNETRIIEINPRFGGGYPIAHQAGADFAELLLRETLGNPLPTAELAWQVGLAMTRWDEAVFMDRRESHAVKPREVA
ncbi:MAG: ATP-grasp domain-containing protein [Planctomycetota bacterium]